MYKFTGLLVVMTLAGCGGGPNQFFLDGVPYSGKVRADRADRTMFVVEGGPVSSSMEGAVLVAEYEAVQYCIIYLGTSDIAWTVGPDTDPSSLPIDGGSVVLTGRCVEP